MSDEMDQRPSEPIRSESKPETPTEPPTSPTEMRPTVKKIVLERIYRIQSKIPANWKDFPGIAWKFIWEWLNVPSAAQFLAKEFSVVKGAPLFTIIMGVLIVIGILEYNTILNRNGAISERDRNIEGLRTEVLETKQDRNDKIADARRDRDFKIASAERDRDFRVSSAERERDTKILEMRSDRDKTEIKLTAIQAIADKRFPDAPSENRLELLAGSLTNISMAQARVESKLDAVYQILASVDKSFRPEFEKEFPLGYAVFTFLGPDVVVPFTLSKDIKFDWTKCSVNISANGTSVILPDITTTNGLFTYENVVALPRKVGARSEFHISPSSGASNLIGNVFSSNDKDSSSFYLSRNPTTTLTILIVQSAKYGPVLLIGLKPYKNPDR
jgi:hypothetical protein